MTTTHGVFSAPALRQRRLCFLLFVCCSVAASMTSLVLVCRFSPRFPNVFFAALAFLLCLSLGGFSACSYLQKQRFFASIAGSRKEEHLQFFTERDLYDFLISLAGSAHTSSGDETYYHLLQKQAELNVMQNQINPHFLYNTLECIRGLALEQGADETANMAELLSKLFRYYISNGDDMQPIENELLSVDNYMKIQQYRFHNRFVMQYDVDYDNRRIMAYQIPKLTLQPIIENIIRHAFNSNPVDNRIVIAIEATQNKLTISICDNGDGMSEAQLNHLNERFTGPEPMESTKEEASQSSGTGIALSNVNMRIQMVFGQPYGLTAFSSLGLGTEIQIALPYEEKIDA